MSTNFHIGASRAVTVNKTGVIDVQTLDYSTWQTPTKVTDQILLAMLPVEAYKAWVMSISKDEEEPVYAEDDWFCEESPIGTKMVNAGKEECIQVDEWIADAVVKGYELEFFGM